MRDPLYISPPPPDSFFFSLSLASSLPVNLGKNLTFKLLFYLDGAASDTFLLPLFIILFISRERSVSEFVALNQGVYLIKMLNLFN